MTISNHSPAAEDPATGDVHDLHDERPPVADTGGPVSGEPRHPDDEDLSGFCGLDEHWRLTFISPGLARCLGGSPASWRGRPWSDVVGKDTAAWFAERWEAGGAEGGGAAEGGGEGGGLERDVPLSEVARTDAAALNARAEHEVDGSRVLHVSLQGIARAAGGDGNSNGDKASGGAGAWGGGGAVLTVPARRLQRQQRRSNREEVEALMLRLSRCFIAAGTGDLDRGFGRALEALGRHGGADSCYVFEFDASRSSASMVNEWLAPPHEAIRSHFAGVNDQVLPTLFPRAADGQTLRVKALSELADAGPGGQVEREFLQRLDVGAFLLVPIHIDQRVIGLLGVNHRGGPRNWTDAQEQLLHKAAPIFSSALDHRRTQHRLAFHINNAPLAVIEWDAAWRVQQWSPEAERTFGWRAEQVMGRTLGDWPFVVSDDAARVQEITDNLIAGRDASNQLVNRNLTRDGRIITCAWFNSVMRDHAGALVSILSFARDVSDMVATQSQLQASRRELEVLHAELRQRAAGALRESELRYRHLADAATDLISCHDLEGQYLYASPAAEALLGYPPAQLVGLSAFDLIHPDDAQRIHRVLREIVETDGGSVETYRLRHRLGHYLWVESTSRVIEAPQPSPVSGSSSGDGPRESAGSRDLADAEESGGGRQIVAVTRDATARLEAESALRDSESRYRRLAEHATDMISTHDEKGRFTYVSPAGQRLLGYSNNDLRGTMPRELAHPNDRQAVIDSLDRLRRATRTISTTFRARRKDGRYVWLESSSRNDGREITVVSRDVTDRLHAEQQLQLVRQAVDQVRDAVVITDNQLRTPGPHILYVNPAFATMTGYEPGEILGQSPRFLQGPQTDTAVLERLRECLREGQAFFGETINYHKDGSPYQVEWNINPVTNSRGVITHWVAIQRDITARKTAEQVARLHRDELAHATRVSSIGEMASGLAHELNQPLTAVRNYIEGSLRRLESNPDAAGEIVEPLRRAAEQAGRAGQIIRGIRNFVTKRETHRNPQALNDILQQTLTLLDAELQTHLTTIDLRLDERLPPVEVNGIQIEQVLLNLIRNALEAMATTPPAQRRLEITSQQLPPDKIQITIRDHGPGLEPAQLDRLFHPFFSTKGGMGIGLTISQSIIQAHGGHLHAMPHPQQGLIFVLTLPMAPDTVGTADAPDAPDAPEASAS